MHLVGEHRDDIDGGERGIRRDNSRCINCIREVIANGPLTRKLRTAIFLFLQVDDVTDIHLVEVGS
jgi:hypothetical protein